MAQLEHFTHSLTTLSPDNACQHCGQYDQWVSHGYVYKDASIGETETVGKRIVCTNRYGRTGCGHTRQLYLADAIPNRHYRFAVLIAFIKALLGGTQVEQAYLNAIGCISKEARQAWRWLNAFMISLPQWRTLIGKPLEIFNTQQRSQRLHVLLSTLDHLFHQTNPPNIQAFQYRHQRAFF